MKKENTISLTLSTKTGSKSIYSIKNPRPNVQKEEVLKAAEDILDSKVFAATTKDGHVGDDFAVLTGARYIERSVTDYLKDEDEAEEMVEDDVA